MLDVAILAIALLVLVPAVAVKTGVASSFPANTVTVSGFATSQEKNQVAVYSAGVTQTNADRETAVNAVNTGVNALIDSLKQFGIPEADIQTQNLSLYQLEEPLFQGRASDSRESVWQANNTVEVRLRDVTQATALTDLLTKSGATNVYGPNFQLDVDDNSEDALITDAINNAREKAEQIATSSNMKLGKIVTVSEGSSSGGYPVPMMAMARDAAVGSAVEPGTSTVSKSMSVTFALKPKWWPL